MKTTLLACITIISLATPASATRRAGLDFSCRNVQREVQLALGEVAEDVRADARTAQRVERKTGRPFHESANRGGDSDSAHHGDRTHQGRRRHDDGRHPRVVAAVRILREYQRTHEVSGRCGACILREFARDVPIGEQSPCGRHDVCVAGSALRHNDDECATRVCTQKPFCCFGWWTDRCVNAAERACEFRCDICVHDACIDGVALPSDCDECTARVCAVDPYCCDTAWDDRCVARAGDDCGDWCAPPTTTTTTTTTSTTTTTAPVQPAAPPPCSTDSQCDDGNVCTNDFCETDGSCSHRNNRAPCEDGNLCTLNDSCSFGTCRGGARMDCDDTDACTFDWCHTSGECRHRIISCNDADRCTVDTCDPTVGCSYAAADCDDGDSCTIDDCHRSLGCVSTRVAVCPTP